MTGDGDPVPLPIGEDGWADTTRWIRDVSGLDRLDRLLTVADRLRVRTDPAHRADETWHLLDLSLRRADLPPAIAGMCRDACPGDRSVVVNRNDDHRRQNFTIAHEVGHLLLGPDSSTDHTVEPWCDRFAARLLCSPSDLRAVVGDPNRIAPESVRHAAARLGLSLSATVVALSGLALPAHTAVMLIRCYRQRPQAPEAARIAVSASPTVFLPPDRRLRRIGLTSLAEYADRVHAHGVHAETDATLATPLEPAPDRRTGRDQLTSVRAVLAGVRRPVLGPARWSAVAGGRNDVRYVIAVMTFDLTVDTTSRLRRPSAVAARAASGFPGQMKLD